MMPLTAGLPMKLAALCPVLILALTGCPSTSSSVDAPDGDITVTSEAVVDGLLLEAFQCEQAVSDVQASIPVAWDNVPDNAGSLAISMLHYPNPDDTDRPNSYLLLWGIPPTVTDIGHGEALDGEWFMGANKDEVAVSYTSPCSPSAGSHEYFITVYALDEVPTSLPTESTIDVTWSVLSDAIATVETLDTGTLTFDSVTE